MNDQRGWILVLGYFASILFAIFVVTAAAKGYHPTIYRAVPLFVWGVFVVGLLAGFVSLYSAIRERSHKDMVRSVLLIGCLYLVFWFYPMQMGLRFWTPPRGDLLMHFGEAKAIAATHSIPELNIYPLSHILIAELHFVTNLRFGVFGTILSLLYYSMLIAGIVLVARRYGTPLLARYVLLAALPLVFNKYTHSFMPWMLIFSLIPLVFVLFDVWERTRDRRQRALISLSGIGFLMFLLLGHLMSGLVAVGAIFGVQALSEVVAWWRTTSEQRSTSAPVAWAFISVLVYPVWYLSQRSFQRAFSTIVLSVIGAAAGSASQQVSRASGSGFSTMQLIRRFVIGKWGTLFLYLGVAGLIWLPLAYRALRRRGSHQENVMTGLFAGGGVFAVFLLVFNFIASNPYRVHQVTLVMAFFVIGSALYWLSERHQSNDYAVVRSCLVVVILGAAVWSPFTIYDEDEHIIETEFEGAEHHLEYRNPEMQTKTLHMSHVLETYLVGSHADLSWQQWAFSIYKPEYQLPKHLGQNGSSLGATAGTGYAITKERDYYWWRGASEQRKREIVYYTREDARQLMGDSSTARIYSNGKFTIWRT
ncbi:hypothetical protein [Haladaptatus salinisoli]|uniref:hypothetical protein n=1 Tax=Haladaptatus salinisoli TaxID=2884876 RepID=UPI001D0B4D8A|nr:hypothetical protein [Haladaptatus salinisoli]